MGNPSNAVVDINQPGNYLLDKPQYAVSYNRDLGRPNWVSWHLSSTWLGSAARQDDFRPDATLPVGWYQVLATDYSGSGFDRGHHCPSADRTNTVADNSATFLMSNMMPQSPDNNQGPWANLESYCRTLVSQGNELYIIAGGSGSGGTGSNGGTTFTVANGHVGVPSQTWKIILVLPSASGNDVTRVTTSTRVIAILMPNTQGIRANDWKIYRVSVDQVESLTGYDFLSNVPVSIQSVIEASVDNQ
jgi:endonuclease G